MLSSSENLGEGKGQQWRAAFVSDFDATAEDFLATLIPARFEAVTNEFNGSADCFLMLASSSTTQTFIRTPVIS